MSKADSGRVGKSDRMYQDQLLKVLEQSVRWLGNGRMSGADRCQGSGQVPSG